MKKIRGILFAAMVMISAVAVADWTPQNEQACDNNRAGQFKYTDEIYLSCTENGPKKSSNTLDEVRICFDKDTLEFTNCEDARDTCLKLKKVMVTPVK